MKKLANMDINALMGAGGGRRAGAGDARDARDARGADRQPARHAEGLHAARLEDRVRRAARDDKQKPKDKRKAEKAARKKNRR